MKRFRAVYIWGMLATIWSRVVSSCLLFRCVKVKIYKAIILPFVLYGCDTWSLTLRDEHRLRVFENRVLRRIFGPKRDEVRGEWWKLHNEELHNLYSFMNIIRRIVDEVDREFGTHGREKCIKVLMGKSEGKRSLRRPRHREEDRILGRVWSGLNRLRMGVSGGVF
jgi:hypothetical protein